MMLIPRLTGLLIVVMAVASCNQGSPTVPMSSNGGKMSVRPQDRFATLPAQATQTQPDGFAQCLAGGRSAACFSAVDAEKQAAQALPDRFAACLAGNGGEGCFASAAAEHGRY